MSLNLKEKAKEAIEEVLQEYPQKTAKKRAKHLGVLKKGNRNAMLNPISSPCQG